MRELYVFCEGPTEQGFCNQVLRPHLFPLGDGTVHTIRIAQSKRRGAVRRGGIGKYMSLKRDIQNTLKSRSRGIVYFTSLIDLYGLPRTFPGIAENVRDPSDPARYCAALESAFGADIDDARFLPHLQLHEYETALFADPEAFRIAFDDCDSEIEQLHAIVASVPTIEHIDDGRLTAPSKRIIDIFPEYDGRKASAGPDIAEFIGIARIREKSHHFDQWLSRLESFDWGDQSA